MNEYDDLNLEEIEAQLYSQVFHSNETDDLDILKSNIDKESVDNMRPPSRYFNNGITKSKKFVKRDFNKTKNMVSSPRNTDHQNSTSNFMKPTENQRRGSSNGVVVVGRISDIFFNSKNQKRAKKKARQKLRRQLRAEQEEKQRLEGSVVIISDSEEEQPSLVKEEELDKSFNSSGGDDVIFIEPPPVEVIDLEESLLEAPNDTLKKSDDKIIEENTSLTSTPKKSRTIEQKELLGTPESTNDFIDNSNVELSQSNFNFSLHGADFNHDDDFQKPQQPLETCETETSSSTVDINSTPIKAAVFSEIEFPREDLFSDTNLENFGNLITPVRAADSSQLTNKDMTTPKQSSAKRNIYESSDSSSESDFDEDNSGNIRNKKIEHLKKLPNLSPMARDSQVLHNKNEKSVVESTSSTIRKSPEKSPEIKNISCENSPQTQKRKKSLSTTDMTPKKDLNKSKKRKSESFSFTENSNNINESIISNETITETIESSIDNNDKSIETIDEISNNSSPETFEDFIVIDESLDASDLPLITNCQEIVNVPPPPPSSSSAAAGGDGVSPNKNDRDDDTTDYANYSVSKLQEKMSNDPKLWRILDKDRFLNSTPQGKKCHKCNQRGHIAMKCPKLSEPLKCRLCGFRGHHCLRCPNMMCTQCGTPGNSQNYCHNCFRYRNTNCHLCGMRGHIRNLCPDLWRRYHLTTEPGPLVPASGPPLKPKHQLWCSSCAQRGHLEHDCNFSYTPYPKYFPIAQHYVDVYNENENIYRTEQRDLTINPPIEQLDRSHPENRVGHNLYYQVNPESNQVGVPPRNYHNLRFDANHSVFQEFQNAHTVMPAGAWNYMNDNTNVAPPVDKPAKHQIIEKPINEMSPDEFDRYVRAKLFYAGNKKIIKFLSIELENLKQMEKNKQNVLNMLKTSYEQHAAEKAGDYFRTLNMMLFGVYKLKRGQYHLDTIRHSRRVIRRIGTHFPKNQRHTVYRSYLQIFGKIRHNDVDYADLLFKI